MKKNLLNFFAVLATAVFGLLSGCAVHNRVGWQEQLTFTIINNTSIEMEVLANGRVSKSISPAETTSLGFYNFMGSREVTMSVRGRCPTNGIVYIGLNRDRTISCKPGEIVGNTYGRPIWVTGDGTYRRAESWTIDGVRPLSGGLLY